MRTRLFFRPSSIAAAVVLSITSLSASAAMILPTGGSLRLTPSDGNPVVAVASEYGDFNASSHVDIIDYWPEGPVTSRVTTATVVGNYSPYSLSLNPTARYVPVMDGPHYSGRATGAIGFDLTDDATLGFSFLQTSDHPFWNVFANARLTIRNAQGSIVFGCTGGSPAYDFTFGGCAAGAQPTPTPNEDLLPDDGFIALLAGHYDISFEVDSSILTGVPVHSDFDLNLSVVPLPATLPLLVSGLGVLGLRRRRA